MKNITVRNSEEVPVRNREEESVRSSTEENDVDPKPTVNSGPTTTNSGPTATTVNSGPTATTATATEIKDDIACWTPTNKDDIVMTRNPGAVMLVCNDKPTPGSFAGSESKNEDSMTPGIHEDSMTPGLVELGYLRTEDIHKSKNGEIFIDRATFRR